jgi:hypothetical protein
MTAVLSSLEDLGNAVPVVVVGGGVLGLYQAAVKVYRGTAGSRNDLAKRLNQLAAGVTVRYVEERFGTPAFARTIVLPRNLPSRNPDEPPSRKRTVRRRAWLPSDATAAAISAPAADGGERVAGQQQTFRELVYREKRAWIQVVVDDDDAVARFSITVTDAQPGLPLDGRSLRIGAHNHEYAEAYWFGNPGNYQHYVISSNEIGTGEFGFSIEQHGPSRHRAGRLASDSPLAADKS